MQNREYLYIDKTESLEEGIGRFPSIYIEGSAASGKTTAVKMLIKNHPEKAVFVLDFKQELKDTKALLGKLSELKERLQQEIVWVIIENMPEQVDESIAAWLAEMAEEIANESRFIFVSREKPQKEFLNLLWKGKMDLIPMEKLLFTVEEVRTFSESMGAWLDFKTVYEKTGGWPGCVRMLLYLSGISKGAKSNEELLNSHEMKNYVQEEMLSVLNEDERVFLSQIAGCPWVTEKLAEEVWGIENTGEKLENLHRKGFLVSESGKRRWKAAPLFSTYLSKGEPIPGREDAWYEREGFIAEAIWCLRKSRAEEQYRQLMLRSYDKVYALGLITEDVLKWNEKTPRHCYLRGAFYFQSQNFEGLRKEISNLEKMKEKDLQTREILLNLYYMNPQMPLAEWLGLVKRETKSGARFRMYHLLGNSVTYLCGIRDLSGLFACSKKEENQNARIWKESFGEVEWKCYQLARIHYYLETERKDVIGEEDWDLLREKVSFQETWQIRMVKLYLLCKLQRMQPEEMRPERIEKLENSLRQEDHPVCSLMAECIGSLYAPWYGAREKMSRWLRYTVMDSTMGITEDNYLVFYCRAKGYLLLNQFERAEKILKKLIPYLQSYHRSLFLAEVLFQHAVINWGKNLKGQAVKNTIESFAFCGSSRYVRLYTGYGQKGQQVLEAYIAWQTSNSTEGWNRKKKYNYGNVLRMPFEDYLDTVLRSAKKASRGGIKLPEEYIEERLTMMETIILQDIGRGMSNAEICEELGLKLPTVKGHVYSLFKKLGVNSRVQAVMKGKELGVLE